MKRAVVGYSKMNQELVEQHLSEASFFFSSPSSTMMGVGKLAEFKQAINFSCLANEARKMLEEAKTENQDNPVLFGVVPFDPLTPTRFVIPETLYVSSSTRSQVTTEHQSSHATLISEKSSDTYMQGVETALELFSASELSKVVLSRAIEVATEDEIDKAQFLKNLLSVNSKGYTFSADIGDNKKLMGASPELLVAKKGTSLISNPLAGSRPKSSLDEENQTLSLSLLNTAKDLHEHGLVVEEVERVMNRYCRSLYTPMVPSVIETNTMLHLSTLVEGQVDDPNISVLQVASELHPTPAVCGYPRHNAYEAIRDIEEFDRGYFTGMVGWCDARGNGEWVVTIRCAEVDQKRMKIFAGAGIVDESLPKSELDETSAKMKTILKAAGISLCDQAS
ncbi:isochorismate synthase [Veronia pacifica]|uniref:isochorismate synthase n=1 Tax=Veronia pacifica TaxID=1080227 RepID=A0A1C3EJY7_9GAMM|nr:isochorismate synthase [Veronia pacifica]ODA33533.1 isochorismate synthase [Veronia pacifica]